MKRLILLFVLVCAACQSGGSSTASPASNIPTYFPTVPGFTPQSPVSQTPRAIVSPALTSVPPTSTFTALSQPTPTSPTDLAVYEPYTIDALRSRTYGGGEIEIVKTMEDNDLFTRYLIRYPSDGLNIYGFVNIPKGEGPFPVIIMVHGFVNPADYQILDYSAGTADGLTPEGYIVLHPNLRNYPPSDSGDNLFRVGMSIDVLNLIELVKSGAGPSELFASAAIDHIGLWGHSLGGDIVLRVLTVSSDIKAALLYAPMSGDEAKNSQLLFSISPDPTLQTEMTVPPAVLERISPLYAYSSITAAIQLHHGTADQTIPVAWAQETCDALTAARIQSECLYYPEEDHTFRRRVADQFWSAMREFYKKYLSS